jgi:hypothetical protein
MYAVPLPRKNLREIPLLKIFIIALIWSVVTVVFPYFYNAHEGKFDLIWIFELIERFFLVILLMVPFEIRDFPYDKGHLKTIIAVWGLFKTKVISLIVIFMLCMSRIIFIEYEHSPFYFLLYLSLAIFILVSQTNQNIYFASFWVEALPIFWLILALLFI